jgi:hypothetical protein
MVPSELLYLGRCCFWVAIDFMFPNFENSPAERSKFTHILLISFNVPFELNCPIPSVDLGQRNIADRATVPPTALHKNREL